MPEQSKVYIVIKPGASTEGDGDMIIGVYTSREQAESILVNRMAYTDCSIEVWDVDDEPRSIL